MSIQESACSGKYTIEEDGFLTRCRLHVHPDSLFVVMSPGGVLNASIAVVAITVSPTVAVDDQPLLLPLQLELSTYNTSDLDGEPLPAT